MKRLKIKDILSQPTIGAEITVKGWVRAFRSNRFIQLSDGSTINTLQAVVDFEKFDETLLKKISTAAALSLTGTLVESQGSGQAVELMVNSIDCSSLTIRDCFNTSPASAKYAVDPREALSYNNTGTP